MNAEESIRSLQISKTKYANGDISAAIKFAKKSLSLHSSTEAKEYLAFLTSSSETTPEPTPEPTRKQRDSQPARKQREYSQKQADGINRIKQCKGDHYAVLDLEKSATESEIKKSYRKVHSYYRHILNYLSSSWHYYTIQINVPHQEPMKRSNLSLMHSPSCQIRQNGRIMIGLGLIRNNGLPDNMHIRLWVRGFILGVR